MALADDLTTEVKRIFKDSWQTTDGEVVPETDSIALGNEAKKLDATVLYADMAWSTKLVDNHPPEFAAEVYKSYLLCAARIIRSEGAEITAYDGDRVMAVFLGGSKNTTAARVALKINYARIYVVNPALKAQYPAKDYELHHAIGIDTSGLLVARTGIRGSNDLVWVGRAANYAAKLSSLPDDYTYITPDVYDKLNPSLKLSEGRSMWETQQWSDMNDSEIYRSSWWWNTSYQV
jgi:class 3 adenylate cyclase